MPVSLYIQTTSNKLFPWAGSASMCALRCAKHTSKFFASILPPSLLSSCKVATFTSPRSKLKLWELGKLPSCYNHNGDSNPGLWPQTQALILCESCFPGAHSLQCPFTGDFHLPEGP